MQTLKKKNVGKQLAELHLPPMKEQLPSTRRLEVLVNHENIWANLQGHNLTGSSFNLEDTDRWHPFIDHGDDGWVPPRAHADDLHEIIWSVLLTLKLPPQRLSSSKRSSSAPSRSRMPIGGQRAPYERDGPPPSSRP